VGHGTRDTDTDTDTTVVTGGARLGDALRSSWERLQGHAKANTTGDYEGLLVKPATTWGGSGQAAAERAQQITSCCTPTDCC
jgi:hypothetical protein